MTKTKDKQLVGADVLTRTRLIEDLRAAHVHRTVLTAVDIALHDLLGKLTNVPCYALWGGAVRPGTRTLTSKTCFHASTG